MAVRIVGQEIDAALMNAEDISSHLMPNVVLPFHSSKHE